MGSHKEVLSQSGWKGGVICTFSFYKDHPDRTGGKTTNETIAIVLVRIINA